MAHEGTDVEAIKKPRPGEGAASTDSFFGGKNFALPICFADYLVDEWATASSTAAFNAFAVAS